MRGAIVLIGDSEPGEELGGLDADLVAGLGRRRPRVVVLPTAASGGDDRDFARAAADAIERFRRLGADVEGVMVRDAATADDLRHAQAVGEADLIWFTGGRERRLLDVLPGSAVWHAIRVAHDRGALVAGCAAAACALAGRTFEARPRFGRPLWWRRALGLAPEVAVLPAYDARPEPVRAVAALIAPRDVTVVGLDRGTALVGRGEAWQVHGVGRATLWRGRHRERHRPGDVLQLEAAGEAGDAAGARSPD